MRDPRGEEDNKLLQDEEWNVRLAMLEAMTADTLDLLKIGVSELYAG